MAKEEDSTGKGILFIKHIIQTYPEAQNKTDIGCNEI